MEKRFMQMNFSLWTIVLLVHAGVIMKMMNGGWSSGNFGIHNHPATYVHIHSVKIAGILPASKTS